MTNTQPEYRVHTLHDGTVGHIDEHGHWLPGPIPTPAPVDHQLVKLERAWETADQRWQKAAWELHVAQGRARDTRVSYIDKDSGQMVDRVEAHAHRSVVELEQSVEDLLEQRRVAGERLVQYRIAQRARR